MTTYRGRTREEILTIVRNAVRRAYRYPNATDAARARYLLTSAYGMGFEGPEGGALVRAAAILSDRRRFPRR